MIADIATGSRLRVLILGVLSVLLTGCADHRKLAVAPRSCQMVDDWWGGGDYEPSWSRDGSRIAFVRSSTGLYVTDVSRGGEALIVPAAGVYVPGEASWAWDN